MSRRILYFAILSLFATGIPQSTLGQRPQKAPPPPWRCATIFVFEIEQLNSGFLATSSQGTTSGIRARVIRVLQDDRHLGLRPGEFQIPHVWEGGDPEIGQRYLVYSDDATNFAGATQSFNTPVLITSTTNYGLEMEEVLALAHLPADEQYRHTALAVDSPARPHSSIFARFVSSLLAMGSYSDTVGLAHALDGSDDTAFSEDGKFSLLWHCRDQLMMLHELPPENMLSVFFKLSARYFLAEPKESKGAATPIQLDIFRSYVPWIRDAKMASGFRSYLSPTSYLALRAKVAELAADVRLRGEDRESAREFLGLLGPL